MSVFYKIDQPLKVRIDAWEMPYSLFLLVFCIKNCLHLKASGDKVTEIALKQMLSVLRLPDRL